MRASIILLALALALVSCETEETTPAQERPTSQKEQRPPEPPEELLSNFCSLRLAAVDKRSTLFRHETRRTQKLHKRNQRAERALRGFLIDHPEQFLPLAEYEHWQQLDYAFSVAREEWRKQAIALIRRSSKAHKKYTQKVRSCLARNSQEELKDLEEILESSIQNFTSRATVSCDFSKWDEPKNVFGLASRAEGAIYLSPITCYHLYDYVILRRPYDTSCFSSSATVDLPLCSPRPWHLAYAIETLVHEAFHTDTRNSNKKARNEKQAECYAFQNLTRVGQPLKTAHMQSAAWYLHRFWSAPKNYRSRECRPNGELDKSPGDGVWP